MKDGVLLFCCSFDTLVRQKIFFYAPKDHVPIPFSPGMIIAPISGREVFLPVARQPAEGLCAPEENNRVMIVQFNSENQGIPFECISRQVKIKFLGYTAAILLFISGRYAPDNSVIIPCPIRGGHELCRRP